MEDKNQTIIKISSRYIYIAISYSNIYIFVISSELQARCAVTLRAQIGATDGQNFIGENSYRQSKGFNQLREYRWRRLKWSLGETCSFS
jgi:hypothetical protein